MHQLINDMFEWGVYANVVKSRFDFSILNEMKFCYVCAKEMLTQKVSKQMMKKLRGCGFVVQIRVALFKRTLNFWAGFHLSKKWRISKFSQRLVEPNRAEVIKLTNCTCGSSQMCCNVLDVMLMSHLTSCDLAFVGLHSSPSKFTML